MTRFSRIIISIFFSVIIAQILFFGCGNQNNCKIPITTSSEEALQNFIKGRDLVEKLQNQKALPYLEKAIAADSSFALAYYYYALAQPTVKELFTHLDKAVSLIDEASDGEKYIILALQAQINSQQQKQKEYFEKLVKEYPNDERSYLFLGHYYYQLQEFNEAISNYRKAIEINKEFAPIYNILGYAFRFIEKYPAAEKSFKKYISLSPDDPNPFDSYGELLLKMGEYEASLDQYEKAIDLDSSFVPSYIGIATNLNYKEQHEQAREKLNEILNFSRNDAEKRAVYFAIAVSYTDEGKYKNAIEELKKIYKLAESTDDIAVMANTLVTLANIYFEIGKENEAGKWFLKSYDLMMNSDLPKEIKDNVNLNKIYIEALLLSRQQNFKLAYEKAEQFLAQAETLENTQFIRNAHELFGRIALEEKNYSKVIDHLKQSNQQDPYNLYRLALAFHGLGDKENTIKYLEQTVKFNDLNSMTYALCRKKAKNMLIDLR